MDTKEYSTLIKPYVLLDSGTGIIEGIYAELRCGQFGRRRARNTDMERLR